MKKIVVLFALGAVGVLTVASLSPAAVNETVLTVSLSPGQEVPNQAVRNTFTRGALKGTLNDNKLSWTLTFKRLTGTATAADIHMAVKGKTGPVVVRLCRPCTSGQKGTATLRSSVLNALKLNELYVDIHTAKTLTVRSAAK